MDFSNRADPGTAPDLYKDKYNNYGNESRLLYAYKIGKDAHNLLVIARYYRGNTNHRQGLGNNGSTGKHSDFDYTESDLYVYSKYVFPNYNVAVFAENIFRITPKFSIVPVFVLKI